MKMQHYTVDITQTTVIRYVVEADGPESACGIAEQIYLDTEEEPSIYDSSYEVGIADPRNG